MIETVVTITNPTGMHARPAVAFVQAAARFKSRVWLETDGQRADAKSILSVMSLGAKQGSKLKLVAEGEDELEAVSVLKELVKRGLGEMAG